MRHTILGFPPSYTATTSDFCLCNVISVLATTLQLSVKVSLFSSSRVRWSGSMVQSLFRGASTYLLPPSPVHCLCQFLYHCVLIDVTHSVKFWPCVRSVLYSLDANMLMSINLFQVPNQSSSSSSYLSKRDRMPSPSDTMIGRPKRPRAHEFEGDMRDPAEQGLYEGPENWVKLRKMITAGAWQTHTQQARIAQYDSQMELEDISTCIQETGAYTVGHLREAAC